MRRSVDRWNARISRNALCPGRARLRPLWARAAAAPAADDEPPRDDLDADPLPLDGDRALVLVRTMAKAGNVTGAQARGAGSLCELFVPHACAGVSAAQRVLDAGWHPATRCWVAARAARFGECRQPHTRLIHSTPGSRGESTGVVGSPPLRWWATTRGVARLRRRVPASLASVRARSRHAWVGWAGIDTSASHANRNRARAQLPCLAPQHAAHKGTSCFALALVHTTPLCAATARCCGGAPRCECFERRTHNVLSPALKTTVDNGFLRATTTISHSCCFAAGGLGRAGLCRRPQPPLAGAGAGWGSCVPDVATCGVCPTRGRALAMAGVHLGATRGAVALLAAVVSREPRRALAGAAAQSRRHALSAARGRGARALSSVACPAATWRLTPPHCHDSNLRSSSTRATPASAAGVIRASALTTASVHVAGRPSLAPRRLCSTTGATRAFSSGSAGSGADGPDGALSAALVTCHACRKQRTARFNLSADHRRAPQNALPTITRTCIAVAA